MAPGLRSAAVRQRNLGTLLRILHEAGPVLRSELGAQSGLTRSAIGGLVADLEQMGFVVEEQSTSDGRPGRPSAKVVPRARTNVVISVVLMVDSLTVAVTSLGGQVLASLGQPAPARGWDVESTLARAAAMVDEVLGLVDPQARLFGVGVAIPGLVRHSDQVVLTAPNIQWEHVRLGELLGERLHAGVPILVQNEANAGALAEFRRGAAVGRSDGLFLSGEVGVGGGLIVNGALATGVAGFAGEIGHMPVNHDGRLCRCGSRGCWESEVGEEALLQRGGSSSVDELLVAFDRGDERARAAVAEHGRWVGFGLAGLINTLHPEIVVFGGHFAATFAAMAPAMEAELRARVLQPIWDRCELVASSLGASSLVLGASEPLWDLVIEDLDAAVQRSILPGA